MVHITHQYYAMNLVSPHSRYVRESALEAVQENDENILHLNALQRFRHGKGAPATRKGPQRVIMAPTGTSKTSCFAACNRLHRVMQRLLLSFGDLSYIV